MCGRIALSETALGDLLEIRQWYSEQGASEVGRRLSGEVVQPVESLKDHPDLGRIVPEFGQEAIRELIHPPFRIVYRRDSRGARVVRIWCSERLLRLPSEPDAPEG